MSTDSASAQGATATGVLAISRDDRWAHAYEDESSAVAEGTLGAPGQAASDIEFFDGSGSGLRPRYDGSGKLQSLEPSGEQGDPEMLRQRLRSVVGYAGDYLRQGSPVVESALASEGLTEDAALQRLPQLTGHSLADDLEQARGMLGPHPMDPDLQDRGSFWHNLFVHGLRT